MIAWTFLFVSLIGAWFTLNAHLPQRRTGPFIIPSFFAGWLTSEMPLHHLAWQFVASLAFVAAGALDAWPGVLGLAVVTVDGDPPADRVAVAAGAPAAAPDGGSPAPAP